MTGHDMNVTSKGQARGKEGDEPVQPDLGRDRRRARVGV